MGKGTYEGLFEAAALRGALRLFSALTIVSETLLLYTAFN
jgi:hypothetical protein